MKKISNDFESIRNQNRLLFEYTRGSTAYGLNTPQSDIDLGGVFIAPVSEYCTNDITLQVMDESHDTTWYELTEFIHLLKKSNPTVLEALFVSDADIHYIHPLFKELRDNRDKLLSKAVYMPFYGYAKQQISKARGLNKKIVNPVTERKTILDFCYTFYKQGSFSLKEWSNYYALPLEYFGLNNIPNMINTYGAFYDWKRYFNDHPERIERMFKSNKITTDKDMHLRTLIKNHSHINIAWPSNANKTISKYLFMKWLDSLDVLGYTGILKNDDSTQLRLNSIQKGQEPLIHIIYNEDGFKSHCKKYREYQEWIKQRNPVRYESNLNKTYDSKNMMHCFRLIHMCIEILSGKSFNIKRIEDHDFLMNVRNHKYEYDELITKLELLVSKMNDVYKNSTLPEQPDTEWLDNYLANTVEKYIKK